MKTTLTDDLLPRDALARLQTANAAFAARYPGESGRRRPVHTLYGGAQIFRANVGPRAGELALAALAQYAPDAASFADALGLPTAPPGLREAVYARVTEKLAREAVEDYRVDFEDGYGYRPDAEEDAHALATAAELARGHAAGTLPPFVGVRIKALTEELRARSVRTLDLFVTTLVDALGGRVPEPFVVTLPKVTVPEQPALLAALLTALEQRLKLHPNALAIELMVETPQSLIDHRGNVALPALVAAAEGRCVGAHFGAYDYTASCGITAMHQELTHPACDFARHAMQVALAGTDVAVADGATTVLPVPPHRATPNSPALTPAQHATNRAVVHRAWRLAYEHNRRALIHGIYHGWDLHPAQLPARYAAVYAFFLEGQDVAGARLRGFVEKAAQASRLGDVFDDAATGQGLLNFFLRAVGCGALTADEAQRATGLSLEELRLRSFSRVLAARRA